MPDLVWNELSITNLGIDISGVLADNPAKVRIYMERLVALMRIWSQAGLSRVIRIPLPVITADLAPGYSLQQWRNDPTVDHDQKQLFRRYSTKTPELEDVLADVRIRGDISEMLCEGHSAQGLLAACLLDGVAVSWDSCPIWRKAKIACLLHAIGTASDLVERVVEIPHAACEEHIRAWLSTRQLQRDQYLIDGPNILKLSTEWLPNVRFVGSAVDQLPEWAPNREGWPFVLRSICQLQDLCAGWGDHPFPHSGISSPCSPEGSRV